MLTLIVELLEMVDLILILHISMVSGPRAEVRQSVLLQSIRLLLSATQPATRPLRLGFQGLAVTSFPVSDELVSGDGTPSIHVYQLEEFARNLVPVQVGVVLRGDVG